MLNTETPKRMQAEITIGRAEHPEQAPPAPRSIYALRQRFVATTPAGVGFSDDLGWSADVAVVDNLTNAWVWLPAARRWVAPGVCGAVVLLARGTLAEIEWTTPPGYTAAADPAGSAVVTFLEAGTGTPPSPGVLVATP